MNGPFKYIINKSNTADDVDEADANARSREIADNKTLPPRDLEIDHAKHSKSMDEENSSEESVSVPLSINNAEIKPCVNRSETRILYRFDPGTILILVFIFMFFSGT